MTSAPKAAACQPEHRTTVGPMPRFFFSPRHFRAKTGNRAGDFFFPRVVSISPHPRCARGWALTQIVMWSLVVAALGFAVPFRNGELAASVRRGTGNASSCVVFFPGGPGFPIVEILDDLHPDWAAESYHFVTMDFCGTGKSTCDTCPAGRACFEPGTVASDAASLPLPQPRPRQGQFSRGAPLELELCP